MKYRLMWIICLLVCGFTSIQITAQTYTPTPTPVPTATPSPTASPAATPSSGAVVQDPIPYKPGEFPGWTYDLRRGEIITIGAFPIAYLVSSLCFDLGRWLVKYESGDPNYARYTPFSANKPDNTNTEITGLIVAAVSVSVLVAVIDFIVGQSQEADRQKLERERKARENHPEAQLIEPPVVPDPPSDPPPDDSGDAGNSPADPVPAQ